MVHAFLRRFELPEKVRNGIARARALWAFRDASALGRSTIANGPVRVNARGGLSIGECVVFVSGVVPCELTVHAGAALAIGDECTFNYGVSIVAQRQVVVGRRCMFGSHVRISDAPESGPARPVAIGDDVWVAHGAVIAPGVRIGDGAVVSAGSVVTQDVPARAMAMGNPARIMSQGLTRTGESG